MTAQETDLYFKIKELKESHDKLYVIMEELQELIGTGYSLSGDHVDGLMRAYLEYQNWKDNKNLKCQEVIPGTFVACGEGGNYCSQACQQKGFSK